MKTEKTCGLQSTKQAQRELSELEMKVVELRKKAKTLDDYQAIDDLIIKSDKQSLENTWKRILKEGVEKEGAAFWKSSATNVTLQQMDAFSRQRENAKRAMEKRLEQQGNEAD